MCVIVLGVCSEAAVFRHHGVLKLEDKAYFTLYGDLSLDAFPADLIPFRIVFTAAGVATFWPDRLEAISPSYPKCYRFEGWLYKEYTSSDGVRLYSTSEELPDFV
jgi:hypothetical protein